MNDPLLNQLLEEATGKQASDLHLIAGIAPSFRINGEIILADRPPLTPDDLSGMVAAIFNEGEQKRFARDWEACITRFDDKAGRVRITLYMRNGTPELCLRFCGRTIPSREELGLPVILARLTTKLSGLVLITGATGSGKTTTLNYLIDLINTARRCKIVTIEDPIEYVHENKKAIVVQQEVLTDVRSFNGALRHVLRQDPDVIVIGEMRDQDAVATALTAAETGHLVLASIHSPSCFHAVERITSVFEGNAQRQVILQLSNSLVMVFAQELVPSADRSRMLLAYELLIANDAVRNTIRENTLHQLENIMHTSLKEGMMLKDACLKDFYQKGLITYDTALTHAVDVKRIS